MGLNKKNDLKAKNKIIWALDPMQDPKYSVEIVKELKAWAKHLNCEVQPVSILSKYTFNYPNDVDFPWKEDFRKVARKATDIYLKKLNAKGFLPPDLVFLKTFSSRTMASEMAKCAARKDALLIFVNTQARKTWNPFRLGGFAETLVSISRIPVLLLNPSTRSSSKIPSILFPTDFGSDSKNVLERLSGWAKSFKSKVLIFNQVEVPTNIYPLEFYGILQAESLTMDTSKEVENARIKKATEFVNILKNGSVKSDILVQRQRGSLSEQIIEIAKKKKVGMIALASESGPVARAILGSVARDVLLQANCPVLVFYRPKAAHKKTVGRKNNGERGYTFSDVRNEKTIGVEL